MRTAPDAKLPPTSASINDPPFLGMRIRVIGRVNRDWVVIDASVA